MAKASATNVERAARRDREVQSELETEGLGSLLVNEIYEAPTFQGEGIDLGLPCWFLRLANCNLRCGRNFGQPGGATWKCDSYYALDWDGQIGPKQDSHAESHQMSIDQVISELSGRAETFPKVKALVVSGGEPLLQDDDLQFLFKKMKRTPRLDEWKILVETNGTIIPHQSDRFVNRFAVSPKLANSGNPVATSLRTTRSRIVPEALTWFSGDPDRRAFFKFVVQTRDEFQEIDDLVAKFNILPRKVYIMPEGVDRDTILAHTEDIYQDVIDRGYRLTTRLHALIWGPRRGV